MMVFDSYSINPELAYLKNTGTATVWLYENSKMVFHNSTVIKDQNYSLNQDKIRSILKLQELTDNWDGEEAIAPSREIIDAAVAVARRLDLLSQEIYHTSPGPNGEILISLRKNQKNIELLFFANKSPKIVRISDDEEPTQEVLNDKRLQMALSWLNA
jgi:hypothetical protein